MSNWMLGILLILALSATTSFAQGVKGGYHAPPSESLVAFPAKESGTCYKRVPYTQALAANISNGYVQTVPGTQTSQQGVKSGGPSVITIIDCCDGFVRNRDSGECETHCDEGCFGGVCSGPNICTCDTGYTAIEGICKPVCSRPCPFNSVCHLPDECKCNEGYEKRDGECMPICPGGCINGECIAPRVCRCKPGFSLNEIYKECVPICAGGCLNGECAGPGFCRCYPGYQNPRGDLESCEPQCPKGCYGGKCLAPGLCKCEDGFNLDSTNTCTPVCGDGCENGKCVAPNQCSCNSGFYQDSVTKKCVSSYNGEYGQKVTVLDQQSGNYGNVGSPYGQQGPHDQQSGNYDQQHGRNYQRPGGYDQQPGSYDQQLRGYDQQLGGYDQQPRRHNQQPGGYDQQPGRYGQQGRPFDQQGSYGLDVDAGQQTTLEVDNLQASSCEKLCVNGQCLRDECICNRGYMLDQTDTTGTRCLPVCYGGCRNGVCSAPNTCLCNPGFTKDRSVKGRQICIPDLS